MCGIVGVAGEINTKEEKVFTDLLYIDGLRGQHSTGVLSISELTNVRKIFKVASPALDAIRNKEYTDTMFGFHRVLIGHNRFATTGKVTVDNAHPFKHGHITGVHNGTLRAQWLLPDHHKFEVDSENIMYAINKEGIAEVAKKLNGAYALVWWDSNKSTLNLFRNTERPLYYKFTKDFKSIVYASEHEMIDLVSARRGLSMDEALYYPKAGDLVSINMHLKAKGLLNTRVHVTTLETYTPPSYHHTAGFGLGNNWFGRDKKEEKDTNVVPITTDKRDQEDTDSLPLFMEGGDGLMFPQDILDQLSYECGWCGALIPKVANVPPAWYDSTTALCESCESYDSGLTN